MTVTADNHITSLKKIILGTVQFGLEYGINNQTGKPSAEVVKLILDSAFESGVRFLDTAEAYGDAQEVIGLYHKSSPNRYKVITKFSKQKFKIDLRSQVRADLQKLQVDSLYGYMFHSFADYVEFYDRFKSEIHELKQQGTILKFGVSVYTNHEFEQLLNKENIDIVQLPFNLLDNISQRGTLLKKAHDAGIEVHTRSVFLQGLFFKDPATLTAKLTQLIPYLQELRKVSEKEKIQLNALALNYVLQQTSIDGVLIGVDTVKQLQDNIRSIGTIKYEAVSQIDSISVNETELLNPANWNA